MHLVDRSVLHHVNLSFTCVCVIHTPLMRIGMFVSLHLFDGSLVQIIMIVILKWHVRSSRSFDPFAAIGLLDFESIQPLGTFVFYDSSLELGSVSWPVVIGRHTRRVVGRGSPKHSCAASSRFLEGVDNGRS
jgi:hypothetical protein